MQCQRCQRQSVPDAMFCSYCGEQLSEVCRMCGSSSARGSNFCHRCGSSLAASAAAGSHGAAPQGLRPSGQTRCPRCNALNEPGALYCLECGLPFEGVRAYAGDVPAHVGSPAGFWIRFGAYLVDSLIAIVVLLIIFGLAASSGGGDAATSDEFTWLDFAFILLGVAYYTFTIAIWSTTAGKRVFGLYVVRPDGSRVGVARAFVRYLAYIPSFLLLFVGVIMIGVRRDRRGMHDLIADTVVVRR